MAGWVAAVRRPAQTPPAIRRDGEHAYSIPRCRPPDDTELESRSTDIKTKAETYRTTLTAYYARLEAAAETAALLLKQLTYSDSSDDS